MHLEKTENAQTRQTGPPRRRSCMMVQSRSTWPETIGDCVARMGRANAVTATFSGFMRSGRSSDVRIRASGSRRQQRWRLLWPRSHQYAIEGHRRSRVCTDHAAARNKEVPYIRVKFVIYWLYDRLWRE